VPADGNCSATLGHLDPTDRGEYYPCNVGAPNTCQVGDLAGKHGNITTSPFVAQYSDAFLSTDPASPAFFGDKSVVIHTANTTRITCANFKLVAATNGTKVNSTSPAVGGAAGTGSSSPSQSVQPFTGAASRASGFGAAAVVVGAAAFFL